MRYNIISLYLDVNFDHNVWSLNFEMIWNGYFLNTRVFKMIRIINRIPLLRLSRRNFNHNYDVDEHGRPIHKRRRKGNVNICDWILLNVLIKLYMMNRSREWYSLWYPWCSQIRNTRWNQTQISTFSKNLSSRFPDWEWRKIC